MTLTRLTLASAIALAFGLSACSDGDTAAPEAKTSETQNASNPNAGNAANPLLKASTLPFQTPDFAAIKVEHFLPAIEEGMKQQLAEIRAIADNPEPPTVANTLDAMERSGELLKRANSVFNSLTSTDSTEQLRKIDAELSPKLAAHDDAIVQVHAVHHGRHGEFAHAVAHVVAGEMPGFEHVRGFAEGVVRAGSQVMENQ